MNSFGSELKGASLGFVGGIALGRALGIGIIGTLLGAFAGAAAGVWLATASDEAKDADAADIAA